MFVYKTDSEMKAKRHFNPMEYTMYHQNLVRRRHWEKIIEDRRGDQKENIHMKFIYI